MDKELIDRINEYSRIARVRPLTDEEARDRHELRKRYLEEFRSGMRSMLENTSVQYPDGTRIPLDQFKRKP